MNIGFDLDKIFIEYPFFIPDFIIDKGYKKIVNGKLIYRIPSKAEQLLRLLIHFTIFRQPIRKNIVLVKKLALKNANKHYLISGRFGFLKKKTNEIVKKYDFDKTFDGLYFNFADNQPHIFKNNIIKKLKLDLYVDDDLQLLEYLARENPKVKFFWLNNKINKQISSNLFAITHLLEMFVSKFTSEESSGTHRLVHPSGDLR